MRLHLQISDKAIYNNIMKRIRESGNEYFAELNKRLKKSRAYQLHQSIGVEIAQILEDGSHISLYIKLAKQHNQQKLLTLAKSIAEKKNVKNKGGYFMKLFHSSNEYSNGKK